jgi:predicted HTH transcriptional regulator
MTEEEFREYLALGREGRRVEFEGPGSRKDKHFLARVVRAVIGMANRRDGGLVIIGVQEQDDELIPAGLSEEQLRTWIRYDDVAKSIGNYTDPSVGFGLEAHI